MAGKLHHLAQSRMATDGIINETLWLGLYTNAIELTRDKILSDLVELGGYTGYERIALPLVDWVDQIVSQATVFSQAEKVWTFSFTPSEDITGYFITNGTMLIATEHFTLPVSPDRPGFELKVTPVMVVR